MNKNKRNTVLLMLTLVIVWGNLGIKTCESQVINNYKPHRYCGEMRKDLLKESVDQLRKNGVLTENDVKNIDSYMNKEREAREKEIKEKIYNAECEKIENMVEGKIITKEKGDRIKDAMKENLQ